MKKCNECGKDKEEDSYLYNPLRAEIKRLRNENLIISDDSDYYRCIFDGSWPSAIEILERKIKEIKAKKKEKKKG